MFCFINPSQLHQTPGEMERHSAVLADSQANIQNNNQQISATSLPLPSPLPPTSLTYFTLCLFIDIDLMYPNMCSVWTDVLIYISVHWTAWEISTQKMDRKEPLVLCQCSRLDHWFSHYRTARMHKHGQLIYCSPPPPVCADNAPPSVLCSDPDNVWMEQRHCVCVCIWYECLFDYSG